MSGIPLKQLDADLQARLPPAPALADALKVVRQNAAGDAYEVVAPSGGNPSPTICNRLGTTPPDGASAFEAVWNFDLTAGQLNDRTANGHNATLAAGTLRATRLAGLPCVHSDSGKLSVPTSAALRTLAAVTIETSIRWRALTGYQCLLVCGDGTNQANNINYSLYINNANQTFFILHQHGNLVSDAWTTAAAAPLCDLCYVALVRNAAGTAYDLYLNGTLLDSTTGMTAPTDGGSSTLRLLDAHGSGQATLASILDLRISMQAMTSGMIADVWTGLITP